MGIGVGSGRGGRRPGEGRPRGSGAKAARARAVEAQGRELPLDRLLRRMCDPGLDEKYRDSLVIAACPFLHPKLSVVGQPLTPFEISEEQLRVVTARAEAQLAERQGQPRLPLAIDHKTVR